MIFTKAQQRAFEAGKAECERAFSDLEFWNKVAEIDPAYKAKVQEYQELLDWLHLMCGCGLAACEGSNG